MSLYDNVIDRRASERRKWEETIVIETSSGNSKTNVKSVDISKGGIGIITERELYVGQIVKVYLPIMDDLIVPVFAEVLWSKPINKEFRNGLCFIH